MTPRCRHCARRLENVSHVFEGRWRNEVAVVCSMACAEAVDARRVRSGLPKLDEWNLAKAPRREAVAQAAVFP